MENSPSQLSPKRTRFCFPYTGDHGRSWGSLSHWHVHMLQSTCICYINVVVRISFMFIKIFWVKKILERGDRLKITARSPELNQWSINGSCVSLQQGNTPLHVAAISNHPAIVKQLRRAGCDINTTNHVSVTLPADTTWAITWVGVRTTLNYWDESHVRQTGQWHLLHHQLQLKHLY